MSDATNIHPPRTHTWGEQTATLSSQTLGRWVVAFCVFTSGFVMNEPAPYELLLVAVIAFWFLAGLRLSRSVVPLLVAFLLYNIGGLFSMLTMHQYGDIPLYLAVSLFLALTSVFFAALIEQNQQILSTIFKAYIAASLATASLGILGYFGLIPGGEAFTRFDRAKGAFQDPNVFGPFLVLPALYLVHGIINGSVKYLPLRALGLAVLTVAIFVSFSRAAWGLYALCGLLLIILLLTRQRTSTFQLKMLILIIAGLTTLIIGFVIILQIDQVAELFSSRAQLVQDYDSARYGRFARHVIGFGMAMEHPLGIGPLEFGKFFGEDIHNMYLKSALAYGWLGLISYLLLICATFYFGVQYMLRDRPWQVYFMLTMIVLFGHLIIGFVIDTDHWRHFYLLIGIAWGCIALEHRHGALYDRRCT